MLMIILPMIIVVIIMSNDRMGAGQTSTSGYDLGGPIVPVNAPTFESNY